MLTVLRRLVQLIQLFPDREASGKMELVSGFPLWGVGLAGLALIALADLAQR